MHLKVSKEILKALNPEANPIPKKEVIKKYKVGMNLQVDYRYNNIKCSKQGILIAIKITSVVTKLLILTKTKSKLLIPITPLFNIQILKNPKKVAKRARLTYLLK